MARILQWSTGIFTASRCWVQAAASMWTHARGLPALKPLLIRYSPTFSSCVQICIALVLHVFVSLFNDGKAFFTAQALPLHIAIISIFTGWLGLGWGFFRVLFSCMGCYGLYRLVPQEQAWDLLKKGIAWQRRNCYSPEGQTRDCSQSPTLPNPQSLLTCPDGVAYGSRKIERGFLFCLVCNAAHSLIWTTSCQPPLHS
jgi:hypothetical protein